MHDPQYAIRYWIQSADFTSEDHTASGASEIQEAFRSHPWSRELQLEESLQSDGGDSCPPGLGIVPDDDRLLHLCPTSIDLIVHYHYKLERRILGMFPSSGKDDLTANVPLSSADELIIAFVAGDHQRILDILKRGSG